jgi:hypothetical protein
VLPVVDTIGKGEGITASRTGLDVERRNDQHRDRIMRIERTA